MGSFLKHFIIVISYFPLKKETLDETLGLTRTADTGKISNSGEHLTVNLSLLPLFLSV